MAGDLSGLRRGPYIPSLGGALSVAPGGAQVYVAHRGLGLLTALDVADDQLSCRAPDGSLVGLRTALRRTDCDRAHLIDVMAAAQELDSQLRDERDFADVTAVASVTGPGGAPATSVLVGFAGAPQLLRLDGSGLAGTTVRPTASYNLNNAALEALLPSTDGSLIWGSTRRWQRDWRDAALLCFDLAALTAADPFSPGVGVADLARDMGSLDAGSVAQSRDGSHLYGLTRRPETLTTVALVAQPQRLPAGAHPHQPRLCNHPCFAPAARQTGEPHFG